MYLKYIKRTKRGRQMELRKVSIIILMIIMIFILLFVRGKIIENKFLLDKINGLDSMIFEAEDSIN